MSRYVASLVYRKKVGSMARKSILAYCAERASDDGSGVWASKVTISKEVECSKKTVIDTIAAFVEEGLMSEEGRRKCTNGFVVVYRINVAQVEALPDALTKEEIRGSNLNRSPDVTPRGEPTSPQEVNPLHPNRPKTVLKPSIGESDLFSAEDQTHQPAKKKTDPLKTDFDSFFSEYPRKAEPDAAFKNYKKARKESSAETLLDAARAYAAEVRRDKTETKFIKLAKNWLSAGAWREVEVAAGDFSQMILKPNQESMLKDGICPPSLKNPDGTPSAAGRYWLGVYGYREAAE